MQERETGMSNQGQQVTVVKHPLVDNSLVALRDVNTGTDIFRRHARLLTLILAFHVLEDMLTRVVSVRTPLEEMCCLVMDRNVICVLVLRTGLAMSYAM